MEPKLHENQITELNFIIKTTPNGRETEPTKTPPEKTEKTISKRKSSNYKHWYFREAQPSSAAQAPESAPAAVVEG